MMWLQVALTALAGLALWKLWRVIGRAGRAVMVIVGLGLAIRALVGQALFWISWMKWPIGRSLQVDDGLWFFALDAATYLGPARKLLQGSVTDVLLLNSVYPSHTFVQILTFAMAAFGDSSSVGLLVNLFAYAGTCWMVLHMGNDPGAPLWPRVAALVALSFGPSAILWSLQPLKDTVFQFWVVAFVAALSAWQRTWRRPSDGARRRSLAWIAVALAGSLYTIAGIRWYFAAILCAASVVFFGLTALGARRGWLALAAPALTTVLLLLAFRFGGQGDIPRSLRNLMDPTRISANSGQLARLREYVVIRRHGFSTTPGATTITQEPAPAPVAPPSPPPAGAAPPAAVAAASGVQPATPQSGDGRDTSALSGVPATVAERREDLIWPRFVALVAPRSVAAWLGVHMGGGRGFWMIADLDTLIFDAVLCFAAVFSVGRLAAARLKAPPLFVALVLVLVATTWPMLYTVNNFGTLFRLRQMLYVIAALIPIALATPVRPGWTSDPRTGA